MRVQVYYLMGEYVPTPNFPVCHSQSHQTLLLLLSEVNLISYLMTDLFLIDEFI